MNRNFPTAPAAAPMFEDEAAPLGSHKLIAYRYLGTGTGQIHFASRSGRELETFLSGGRRAGRDVISMVTYPANWAELGSSAKDLWEERQMNSIRVAHSATSKIDRLARRLLVAEGPHILAASKRSRLDAIRKVAETEGFEFDRIAKRADEIAAERAELNAS